MARTDRTPADDLRIVVDHWTHMRDLIDTVTPEAWPPGGSRYLAALDEHDAAEVAAGRGAAERERLVLAETSAPLRLHVLDACRAVEAALCSLADELAAEVQRAPVPAPRRAGTNDPVARDLALLATRDDADPHRWRYNLDDRSAPKAAAWLRARLLDEPGPCRPLDDAQRARVARVAREAAQRIERTIGAEHRSVPMDDQPCPWCAGRLVMHAGSADAAVTCDTGHECSAPVPLDDGGRRVWRGGEDLIALNTALNAAERRRRRRDQKRAERARARAA